MKFESFIAFRYLKSKRHSKFISFITMVSFLGITIGMMTLITVLSVMNGMQANIKDKIINVGYHIYLTSYSGTDYLQNYKPILSMINKKYPEVFATPFFKGQVLVKTSAQRLLAVDLHGVDPLIYKKDKSLKKTITMEKGHFSFSKNSVVIGTELAKFLGVSVGDTIDIISPEGKKSKYLKTFMPTMKKYTVRGLFKSGYYEYDLKLIFVSLSSAQQLFDRPNKIWGIGIKMPNFFQADNEAMRIKKDLNYKYQVFSWHRLNHNLFVALKNEKTMLSFIVFLIILVAAFNIASSLIMMVMEKKKDIGILMAIGAKKSQIKRIFLMNGLLIGFLGTLFGTLLGLLLSYNLDAIFQIIEKIVNFLIHLYYITIGIHFYILEPLPFHILAKDVYYFDKLPILINYHDILWLAAGSILVTFIFSIIPTAQISKMDPVEAIRYE